MAILYLIEQGSVIRKQGGRIRVEKDDQVITEIPAIKLEGVVIYGNASLTTPAMRFFLSHGVNTSFMNMYGKLEGRLTSLSAQNGLVRKAQILASTDEEWKMALARSFVRAKISNQRTLLSRHYRRKENERLAEVMGYLEHAFRQLEEVKDLDSLRGIEGNSSAVYFSGLRELVPPEMGFQSRVRRPPKDPVNAMLSLGYSLLLANVVSAIEAAGLDPYNGFLHGDKYGKPSLALDMMEEWRPVVVDSLVIASLRRKMFRPNDFIYEEEGTRFTQEALRRFVQEYNGVLYREFKYGDRKEKRNYLFAFYAQGRMLAKHLMGQGAYKPFLMR